jgi:hypothetical protein
VKQSSLNSATVQSTLPERDSEILELISFPLCVLLQIFPEVFHEVQPKLSEERWKSSRYAKIPGNIVKRCSYFVTLQR